MRKLFIGGFVISLSLFFSCKKNETVNQTHSSLVNQALTSGGCSSIPIIDSMPNFDANADSIERPTILGNQRTNPYTLSNMRIAYNNLGYSAVPVNATNLYVRFLPNSVQQLSILDSTLDAQNLEMFDAPMDYDVLQEGDYYQDPSINDSLPTWQYAVVPTTFTAPAGITYQVLSQIHIPADNYEAIETEAERLASRIDSINCAGGGGNAKTASPYVLDCPPGYHWDFTQNKCVCDCCPTGYHWDAGQQACVQDPPPPPPGVSPNAQIPAGMINVSDVNLHSTPGVRNVRVVAKRWFKIERVYTDNNGNFTCTKHFLHKVKINVKFKNSYCNIRGIRGVRLWQSLYVINSTIGVFSANKNTINYTFPQDGNSTNTKGNRYWVAATTINAVQEEIDYSTQYHFSAPPSGLNIYLTNWGEFSGLASTPLFGKRFIQNLPSSFINLQLLYWEINNVPIIGWYVSFFAAVARARLDMAIDYHLSDMTNFTSDFIKETVYHECGHASQYTYSGNTWYTNAVSAELAEQAAHPNPNDSYNPYGTGITSNSPIIALSEAWGYHIGHFLAEQRYGTAASCHLEQIGGVNCCYNTFTGHPNLDVLENFNPNLSSDPFKWIPKGLMEDLIDDTPNEILVNDHVSGLTIQQIFTALQSDVSTMSQYKARLLQQIGNGQLTQINNLFSSYNY